LLKNTVVDRHPQEILGSATTGNASFTAGGVVGGARQAARQPVELDAVGGAAGNRDRVGDHGVGGGARRGVGGVGEQITNRGQRGGRFPGGHPIARRMRHAGSARHRDHARDRHRNENPTEPPGGNCSIGEPS
jgi:hypothetical protein